MNSRHGITQLVAGLGLAVAMAAAAVGCSDSKGNAAPSPTSATESPTPQPTAVLPADFPDGVFGRVGLPADKLTLASEGAATLGDANGSVNQALSSPGVSRVTFSPDSFLCTQPGTYRYSYQGTTLTFTLVSDDCKGRRDYLLKAPFQRLS